MKELYWRLKIYWLMLTFRLELRKLKKLDPSLQEYHDETWKMAKEIYHQTMRGE